MINTAGDSTIAQVHTNQIKPSFNALKDEDSAHAGTVTRHQIVYSPITQQEPFIQRMLVHQDNTARGVLEETMRLIRSLIERNYAKHRTSITYKRRWPVCFLSHAHPIMEPHIIQTDHWVPDFLRQLVEDGKQLGIEFILDIDRFHSGDANTLMQKHISESDCIIPIGTLSLHKKCTDPNYVDRLINLETRLITKQHSESGRHNVFPIVLTTNTENYIDSLPSQYMGANMISFSVHERDCIWQNPRHGYLGLLRRLSHVLYNFIRSECDKPYSDATNIVWKNAIENTVLKNYYASLNEEQIRTWINMQQEKKITHEQVITQNIQQLTPSPRSIEDATNALKTLDATAPSSYIKAADVLVKIDLWLHKVSKEPNPTTERDYIEYATLLQEGGNWHILLHNIDKAAEYFEQQHKIFLAYYQNTNQPPPSELLNILNNLSWIDVHMRRFVKAKNRFSRSQSILIHANDKPVADRHYIDALADIKLGCYHRALSRLDKAIELYEKSHLVQALAETKVLRATALRHLKLNKQAIIEYSEAITALKHLLGVNHPITAEASACLGVAYHNIGDYTKSIKLYHEAYVVHCKFLPENHIHVINLCSYLAWLYLDGNIDYKHAERYCQRAIYLYRTLPLTNQDSTEIVFAYLAMSHISEALGEYDNQLYYLSEALDEASVFENDMHNIVHFMRTQTATMQNAATTKNPLTHHQKLSDLTLTLFGNHMESGQRLAQLGMVLQEINEYEEAIKVYKRALQMLTAERLEEKDINRSALYDERSGLNSVRARLNYCEHQLSRCDDSD